MKYQYNFSFLSQWLESNPKIPKGEILQALGAKSNNRFKAWVRCEGPMPVLSMLRLCNAYQIPLSAFFRDADAGADGCFGQLDLPDVFLGHINFRIRDAPGGLTLPDGDIRVAFTQ